ncbi:MAG: shikimate kinase [Lachnospiraceae bacterium]|nr:shikimate kinase [Lachnospiraceae bacterium]
MGRLILEGFMGSGKSTCGKRTAQELGVPFFDTDSLIEEKMGLKVTEIFRLYGEERFRMEETALLRDMKEQGAFPKGVISLGGGLPMREENRALLKDIGRVVYLQASAEVLIDRLYYAREGRPKLSGDNWEADLRELLSERDPLYRDAADIVLETDGKILSSIIASLKEIFQAECG